MQEDQHKRSTLKADPDHRANFPVTDVSRMPSPMVRSNMGNSDSSFAWPTTSGSTPHLRRETTGQMDCGQVHELEDTDTSLGCHASLDRVQSPRDRLNLPGLHMEERRILDDILGQPGHGMKAVGVELHPAPPSASATPLGDAYVTQ